MCFRVQAVHGNRYGRGRRQLLPDARRRELLFDQLFEDVIFLLIVASHVDRLTKEHWFFELIIFRL